MERKTVIERFKSPKVAFFLEYSVPEDHFNNWFHIWYVVFIIRSLL